MGMAVPFRTAATHPITSCCRSRTASALVAGFHVATASTLPERMLARSLAVNAATDCCPANRAAADVALEARLLRVLRVSWHMKRL